VCFLKKFLKTISKMVYNTNDSLLKIEHPCINAMFFKSLAIENRRMTQQSRVASRMSELVGSAGKRSRMLRDTPSAFAIAKVYYILRFAPLYSRFYATNVPLSDTSQLRLALMWSKRSCDLPRTSAFN